MIKDVQKFINSTNLCDDIDDLVLVKMGSEVVDWFDEDESSRSDWRQRNDHWLKLATQIQERKTYPWPNSANIKYPLLTTAAMQFAARAYPALVPGPRLVAGQVIGRDEGGTKQEVADRIGAHMSYQVLCEMEDWEEDMDRLCLILPITGCIFKKTYFDPIKNKNVSKLILPDNLVIDYYAESLETAARISQIVWLNRNQVTERIRKDTFRDCNLGEPTGQDTSKNATKNKIDGTKEPKITPATPHKFIECHCSWDLDEDGYDEPYVVTVHYESRQVVRIVTRYEAQDIEMDGETVAKITPTQYFTKFGFIPNPDGSIYDLGFGILLGGINETVNTLTNQLLDAGTINNLQSGFLGRGIRMRAGGSSFIPGEWKPVDFTGDDIKKHIFPLPTKEPSAVLFKLLEALITSGKELASVAEIFVGKMPGQNTPATTTMATIEQGLKVFTAIYKRIYRALGKEYEKLFALNAQHLPDKKLYFTINEPQGPQSQGIEKSDYEQGMFMVKPNADPNVVSAAQKLMKVQSYGSLLQLGTIQPLEYTRRYLEAVEAENISALINPNPPPSPEQQKMQADMQQKQQEGQQKQQLEQMKAQFAQQKNDQDMQMAQMEAAMKQQEMDMELRFKAAELQMKEKESQMNLMSAAAESQMNMKAKEQEHQQNQQHANQEHELNMKTSVAVGEQKVAQAKAQAKAKPQPKGK